MIRIVLRNILRFIVLVLVQVLVINNMQFSSLVTPFVYTLFILLLPFEIAGWFLLLSAFILGMTIDVFMNTPGLHASATLFMALFRPLVLRSIAPRDGYETGTFPRLSIYGFTWFLKYSVILVVLHHIFLFIVEAFGFSDILSILSRILLSSVISIFLIVLSQYVVYRD